MHPIGMSLIAAFIWIRGCVLALLGLAVMGIRHLGAKLMGVIARDGLPKRLTASLSTSFGMGVEELEPYPDDGFRGP